MASSAIVQKFRATVKMNVASRESKPAVGPADFGMPAAWAEARKIVFPETA
jgi:hypothetical protein